MAAQGRARVPGRSGLDLVVPGNVAAADEGFAQDCVDDDRAVEVGPDGLAHDLRGHLDEVGVDQRAPTSWSDCGPAGGDDDGVRQILPLGSVRCGRLLDPMEFGE